MRVSALALDNVFDTGLATVLDAFQTANELAALSGLSSSRFDVTIEDGKVAAYRVRLGISFKYEGT